MAKNNIRKTGGLSAEPDVWPTSGNNIRPFKRAKKKKKGKNNKENKNRNKLSVAQRGTGETTIGDKLYWDPVRQRMINAPIDTESDKDKQIRHNKRYGFG